MIHNPTKQAIEQYTAALRAERYKVQFKNSQTDKGFWLEYSHEQLLKSIGYLRLKNAEGFDVYARPVGWQYILLDDLTREVLATVKVDNLRPCLLIETSPDNYQAWVILAQCPADRAEAKAVCRSLAERYGADLGSAEPDHVGRLPGLTNRKPKHRQDNGYFPFVRLCKAVHRLADISTLPGGGVLTNTGNEALLINANVKTANSKKDGHSEHDFGIALGLLRRGLRVDQVTAHLLAHSPDLQARKGRNADRYVQTTIENALKVV